MLPLVVPYIGGKDEHLVIGVNQEMDAFVMLYISRVVTPGESKAY